MELIKIHVRKNDKVVVVSGKDKGKTGEVLAVYPKKGKVLVKGIAMVTKHSKPNKKMMQGGISHMEAPIFSSKVMLYCTKCKSATRIAHTVLDNGTKVRVCKKCGEQF